MAIDPVDGFTGEFQIRVTATSGTQSTATTFMVSVTDQAATLSPIEDQQLSHSTDSVTVNLVASDADGDEITFTATADSPAYELSQQYGVHAADSVVATNYFHNVRGQGEKYLQTTTSHGWLYILPNGEVYAWGGSLQASSHIGTLDSSYHADPSSLINVTSSAALVTLTVDQEADTLTIDPVDGRVAQVVRALTSVVLAGQCGFQ